VSNKILGIVGGTGPESTITYYRMILALYRERTNDGSYPCIIINSIDLQRMLSLVADQRNELVAYLSKEIDRLVDAGADFALLASNTSHIVFDELQSRSRIPLVSIVEACCEEVQRLKLSKVGLFGTLFTMQGDFYRKAFDRNGITLCLPSTGEQEFIHQKYMNELLRNTFLPKTERGLLTIIERMKEEEGIEGLLLAGTELPLILREKIYNGIPMLDTAEIHAQSAVRYLLSADA
jgi:aspartate racemase